MLEITRGTTPVIEVDIPDEIDLQHATEIWFSIGQGNKLIVDRTLTDGGLTINDKMIVVNLTQEETLLLKASSKGKCGIRIHMDDGMAWATDDSEVVNVLNIVKDGVI